jgi:hypothetical protein
MHLHLDQVLWAALLSAHLILLIVLLGRDRIARFRWFTVAVALSAARLLVDHLLHGRLTTIAFYWQQYSLLLVASILGLIVLAELARRGFGSHATTLRLKPNGWLGWSLVTVAIAAAAVGAIGPWPTWISITAEPELFRLRLVWIVALKLEIFAGFLAIQLAILLLLFGRRFGTTLRCHATQIALGLSTIAISQIAVQRIIETIVHAAHPNSREEYERTLRLLTNLDHARLAIWLLVVFWWIVCLWIDEPGHAPNPETTGVLVPVGANPISPSPLQARADLPEDDA